MAEYNITELKQEARDNHIDEEGRTERRNIFETIARDVIGVRLFVPWSDKYTEEDFEEAWIHTEDNRCVVMKNKPYGGYRVFAVTENTEKVGEKEFSFSGKKKAESHMLKLLNKYE